MLRPPAASGSVIRHHGYPAFTCELGCASASPRSYPYMRIVVELSVCDLLTMEVDTDGSDRVVIQVVQMGAGGQVCSKQAAKVS